MFLYDLIYHRGYGEFFPLTTENTPSVTCQFCLITQLRDSEALFIRGS